MPLWTVIQLSNPGPLTLTSLPPSPSASCQLPSYLLPFSRTSSLNSSQGFYSCLLLLLLTSNDGNASSKRSRNEFLNLAMFASTPIARSLSKLQAANLLSNFRIFPSITYRLLPPSSRTPSTVPPPNAKTGRWSDNLTVSSPPPIFAKTNSAPVGAAIQNDRKLCFLWENLICSGTACLSGVIERS